MEWEHSGCTSHQWNLTVWVWILGVARVDQVARASRDAFLAIENSLGLSAVAARQLPFQDWRE
eukprot:6987787-Alexandrium_andersonii.AAC.1